ncbi:hypothetical protein ACFQZQ_09095 [Lysobacter koreensis]|uniref:DUF202 domain-containing protein n=1 Tax=Lysobacter koreensis TaxID=266122 RepID=A0ABW2YNL7_9GAMM
MPPTRRESSLLQRGLVGFWFCAIGALGFARFFVRAFDDQGFTPDTVAWLWLVGAVITTIAGLAVIVHAARSGRPPTDRR